MTTSPKPGAETLTTRSEKKTFELAKQLAESFHGDEVVCLTGELGAGKTVFAKGIASGLGLKDTHQVCSPSYTLLNIYQARVPIYHFDLYRLEGEAEIRDLGFEDYIGAGVVIIEWAEKITFPLEAIQVMIEVGGDDIRTIHIRFRN